MSNKFNIKLPIIDQAFYTTDVAKQNEDKINNVIIPKYGSIIKNVSKITKVPEQLITGFIFVESAGDEKAKSPYATGLLELSPATASDVIVREEGLGRLEEPEKVILRKYLGSRLDVIKNVKKNQKSLDKTFVTNEDLFKPEFNILVGSILLGQLLDEFFEVGKLNLSKVIAVYNGGRNSKSSKKIIPFKGSEKQLIAIAPKETADYIKKMAGINGVLEILV